MATPTTSVELIELVRKSGIHTADALERLLADVPTLPDEPKETATELVRRGVLTAFQARLLLTGRYRGFRIGPYIVRDQIGQGGMGTVYLAEHSTLRRRVAIKVLAASESRQHLAVERFQREARAAAALDHPNIVRIFDVGQQGPLHYIVMEHVDGQTLDKVVRHGGPLPCGRAVEYITQAAAGLQHAYEKGFVHRDIKPANLMLARDGTVKILDMGLARSFDDEERLTEVLDEGAVVGTADYIAPEQAMNNPDLDIRADIYSLGATFFTLVTGRPPFEGNTTQKLLQHQMKPAPTLASIDRTFPPGLSAVVEWMLAKDPADRYQTPAEVIGALAPWVHGSDKVVAALSRTDLSRSPELQNTLNEVMSETTKRLNPRPSPDTGLPKRWPWIAGGAVVVLVGLGLGVAALTGMFSTAPADNGLVATAPEPTPPQEQQDVPPPAPASPSATAAPRVPKLVGVAYDLDLTGRGTFSERGKVIGDPARPNALKWQFAKQTGKGQFPPGWRPVPTTPNGAYDGGVVEAEGGGLALVTSLVGRSPAALLTPTVPFPSGRAKVTVTYRTEPASGEVTVRFHPTAPRDADGWKSGTLPATGGAWKTAELTVDLKTATGGRFEFVAGPDLAPALWVKEFTAVEPAPARGKPLLGLDTGKLQPFVQRTRKFQQPGSTVPLTVVSETGPGKLPPSWYRWIEYDGSVAEFFADGQPNALVLGVRNISGQPGVHLTTPELKTDGGPVRIRILYHTGLTSPGAIVRFQPTRPSPGTIWDVITLPPTGGSWRAEVLETDLRGATGGHFQLYTAGDGPDAAVRFREFVVTDAK